MHGPLAGVLEKFAEEIAIESSQREPFCTARRGRDDVDILRTKTSFAKKRVGISTGKQGKRVHPFNANLPSRVCTARGASVLATVGRLARA